jgi:hypothetical protein
MSQKLKIIALVLSIVIVCAGYNYFASHPKYGFNRRVAKLGQIALNSQHWYRHEYIVSGKLLDQAKREALVKRLGRELQENLNNFKDDITTSYQQVQSIPKAYKLIDDVIQEMAKHLGLIKETQNSN